MEMPERWTDITSAPVAPFANASNPTPTIISRPSVNQGYLRKYNSLATPPTATNQYAECLYLIVMQAVAEEGDAREVFKPDDVKDTDGDGMPEFVDAWGHPIRFLRWCPGFISELNNSTLPDPFDPLGVYANPSPPYLKSFAIYPLVFSAGPDSFYGIVCDGSPSAVDYTTMKLNPFSTKVGPSLMGLQTDIPSEPNFVKNGWLDNIHNHLLNQR
jgi:hypothetical protein